MLEVVVVLEFRVRIHDELSNCFSTMPLFADMMIRGQGRTDTNPPTHMLSISRGGLDAVNDEDAQTCCIQYRQTAQYA